MIKNVNTMWEQKTSCDYDNLFYFTTWLAHFVFSFPFKGKQMMNGGEVSNLFSRF